jgi:hypothetical protein
MRRESSWTSVAVWLVLLAFAFACGALVIGQAFDTRVLALTGHSLRLSADYSADAQLAREQKIAPVDSAVISDTVRDLIVEQTQAPLLLLVQTPGAMTPTLRPTRTPLRLTPTGTMLVPSLTAAATAEFQPSTPTTEIIAAPPDERDDNRPRPTRNPDEGKGTPVSQPSATPGPPATATTQPIVVSTGVPQSPTDTPQLPTNTPISPINTSIPPINIPLSPTTSPVPPTNTLIPPTNTLIPPTNTLIPPTDTPVPPTDTPIPPTDTPVPPTDTPVPPTDTPEPPTDTPEPPTDTPEPPTDTPQALSDSNASTATPEESAP